MASNVTEKFESLLKCPICQVQLNKPKAFQCLHFYCESCIDGMKPATEGSVKGLKCPVCRQITPKDKLRRMPFVNDMLEEVDLAKNERIQCDRCNKNTPTHRCIDCKAFYCAKCKEDHDSHPFLKQHRWEEFSDMSQAVVDKHVYCPNHPSELARINCKDCNELICLICNGTKHKTHQAESIEEALERLVPAIKQQKDVVEKKIQANETMLANLKTRTGDLKKGYKEIEVEINRKHDEVIKKAQEDKKKCIQDLLDMKDQQINAIERSTRDIEIKLKSQRSIIALSDTTLSTVQGTSLLQTIQSDVKGSLDSFMKEEASVDPDSFKLRARFEPVAPTGENLIGTVCECAAISVINSKSISRPLSDLAQITPKLIKEVNLGYYCYRFSIIDEKLWCIQCDTPNIHILDLDGNKTRTLTFNDIGSCRAVAAVTSEIITVATTQGLYQTNMDGKQPKCIVNGDMADVTTLNDIVYALEYNKNKVHVFEFNTQNNNFKEIKQVTLGNANTFWLNAIVATHDSLYLADFVGHAITQYTTDGNAMEKFGKQGTGIGELHYPAICGIDENGGVHIADRHNNRLQVLNNGAWTTMKVDGLQRPVWAAFIKNKLYVTEEVTNKLKVFSYE